MNLVVLYPQPTDPEKFESDYSAHIKLLHEKTGIPQNVKPYTITKFLQGPEGNPPFYQMFTMPFESLEALNEVMASQGMKEVAADANRISTGGAPTILIGKSS
ncbi:MAG: EthD family reductase [Lutibacter sp.]|uniref:EthD family reductase n=1 Tax=Lutibacter sp. TaxID=1925666 RepID=UPI0017D42FFB|nr:EthD family reductase [Lutibacter sp.]MBT8316892.1 EthD family reductase [Lutibacter sp.]NNJ57752.1 EthD family reductase [Lutibacter sp.]